MLRIPRVSAGTRMALLGQPGPIRGGYIMRAIRAVSGRLLTARSHAPSIFVVAALASFFVAPAVASASLSWGAPVAVNTAGGQPTPAVACPSPRSEEHTSELQSLRH